MRFHRILKIVIFIAAFGFTQLGFAQVLTSSNLPIIIINTNGNPIQDEPKILASFKIINNAAPLRNNVTDAPQYQGSVGIEYRGSSSQVFFPKKSYAFQTVVGNLLNTIDTSLLGMPKEHDWILYAPYTDKTYLRDILTYEIAHKMGNYASRYQFVELIVNGQYRGIYILLEKIKRDKNRVDISKLKVTDNSGDQLTGGYIVKIDKPTGAGIGAGFQSSITNYNGVNYNINFLYHYPSYDSITVTQQTYIANYISSFENSLIQNNFADPVAGYRKYIDVPSFIDFFICNEITKNVDGYRLSSYLNKDRDSSKNGKLKMGPIWDFNLGYGNADYCDGANTNMLEIDTPCVVDAVPFWWKRFLQDSVYANDVKCRWTLLRKDVLKTSNIHHWIDSMQNIVSEAELRDHQKWPTIGTYIWPNAYVANSYQGEIDTLKNWISARLNWLDNNLPGYARNCFPTNINTLHNPQAFEISLSPNPCNQYLDYTVSLNEASNKPFSVTIKNIIGQNMTTTNTIIYNSFQNYSNRINTETLVPGLYFLEISNGNQNIVKKFIKQ